MRQVSFLVLLPLVLICLGLPGHLSAAENAKKLGSVGLQVVPTATGELVVLQVPPNTPAASSGIRPGDLVVQINDFPLTGSDFADVVSHHLWGAEGSQVVIHYLRPGESGRKSATLRRAATDPKLTVTPAIRNGNGAAKPGGKK
ncbi:MAG: PDZ domain-containing protein [Desulfuromonadales bacterium]|nr:PDZ domain-containing protein [Desulfuromonadales bacterium]